MLPHRSSLPFAVALQLPFSIFYVLCAAVVSAPFPLSTAAPAAHARRSCSCAALLDALRGHKGACAGAFALFLSALPGHVHAPAHARDMPGHTLLSHGCVSYAPCWALCCCCTDAEGNLPAPSTTRTRSRAIQSSRARPGKPQNEIKACIWRRHCLCKEKVMSGQPTDRGRRTYHDPVGDSRVLREDRSSSP